MKTRFGWRTAFAVAAILWAVARLSGQTMASGTVSFTFSPSASSNQMAVWLESPEGWYAGTEFLTDFIGRHGGGNRTADPALDTGSGNRPDALPVWAHRRNLPDTSYGVPNLYPPPETKPSYPSDMDAVSSATPGEGPLTVRFHAGNLRLGTWTLWAEVNRSFQLNEYHSYSFYRGQPSILWKVEIRLSGAPDSAGIADYTGYGSPDGSDGDIRPPDSTITTAAERLSVMMDGFRFKAVFVPDESGMDDGTDAGGGPAAFMLLPSFPNPFNSHTSVSYALPSAGPVLLSVHDALGRCVRILMDGRMTAGPHAAAWDGRDDCGAEVESGIYLVFLKTDQGCFSRKSLYLK
jgi:hypothetical protein